MRKKIGIVTLVGYFNYGNRLQNYALQQALMSLGYDCETIIFEEKTVYKKRNTLIRLINYFRYPILNKIKVIKRTLTKKEYIESEKIRYNTFYQFSKLHILESKTYNIDNNDDSELLNKYDCFIVGSDQVWNPNYIQDTRQFFLQFTENQKKIAYAASFGISEIPIQYVDLYRSSLIDFKFISVREESGAQIVKELTNTDVQVLVDPTLLIGKEEWLNISIKAKNRPETGYLLTYFLSKKSRRIHEFIKQFAKKNNLSIINLGIKSEKETYRTGPNEFIDYIHKCSILFTDSFHGSVFSILFEKPFVVFDRGDMNSRISTLLRKFRLEDRHWNSIKTNKNYFDINYSHIPIIIEEEKEKSITFLKSMLS